MIAAATPVSIVQVISQTVRPLMQRYDIPGMAVGVVVGEQSYVVDRGVASKATKQPVDPSTLFEIGSVTKTFYCNARVVRAAYRHALAVG